MKKQYIIAVLLLIGAATVSTMAFSIDSTVDDDFQLYDITPGSAAVTVSNVRIRVMNSDTVYFKLSLANSGLDDGVFHISFTNEDGDPVDFGADGVTITWDITGTTLGSLSPLEASGDTVVVVSKETVHATTDYILLKVSGTNIAYDGSNGSGSDLASMNVAAYDSTTITGESAGSYTETEASDL